MSHYKRHDDHFHTLIPVNEEPGSQLEMDGSDQTPDNGGYSGMFVRMLYLTISVMDTCNPTWYHKIIA